MDGLDAAAAPTLPLWSQLSLTAVLGVALIWALRRIPEWPARLVCIAVWMRYIVASYHPYTFPSAPLGISIASLSALAVCALGLAVLRKRHLLLKSLLPIYLLMVVAIASGLAASNVGGMIAVLVKLGYLAVIAICMMEALEQYGDRVLVPMTVAFYPPYLFQWMSVILNVPKQGESDGSASYIGGYGHEGAFSEMLLAAVLVAGLARHIDRRYRLTVILLGIFGVFLANYRTTIVAFAPFLVLILVIEPLRRMKGPVRATLLSLYALAVPVLLVLAGPQLEERFGDLARLPYIVRLVTTSPDDFNREDAQIMSGRALLWARYYDAFENGTTRQQLIGYGPERRVAPMAVGQTREVYAHNTLISTIYEYGLIGLAAYILFFAYMLWMAFQAPEAQRTRVVTLAVSILILNFATMPMWQFEGIILTGLYWGYAMYCGRLARRAAQVRQQGHRRRFAAVGAVTPPDLPILPSRRPAQES